MEKLRYMISDAANIVGVETHVLRYWEEELELNVPRNEMGHRYYTRSNIEEFIRIKELKEQGIQLKAIKSILKNGQAESVMPIQNKVAENTKLDQFRELMTDIIGHAISLNNDEMVELLGKEVEERVLKELNYLMREQDEAEEKRFKKLDAAIRGQLHKNKRKGIYPIKKAE